MAYSERDPLAGLEKQEERTAEMVDYFPLTPFFLLKTVIAMNGMKGGQPAQQVDQNN